MRKIEEEPFMMIFDKLITENEEVHLSEVELYLYSLLKRKQNLEGVTETSISFLIQTSPIEFASSLQRSKSAITCNLLSLIEKKVIQIFNNDGEILQTFKPNDLIKIKFGTSNGGFTKIVFSKFDSIETMSDFYIYVAVERWKNSGNGKFNCSYGRWGNILQMSERHAIDKVNEAIEKKVIYKNIGDYSNEKVGGQKRQVLNQYSTSPFTTKEKSNKSLNKESDEANEEFHANREHGENEFTNILEVSQVFKTYKDDLNRNIYPSIDDYVFYLRVKASLEVREPQANEIQFMTIAEKRIERMKNNKKFKQDIETAKNVLENNRDLIIPKAKKVENVADMF